MTEYHKGDIVLNTFAGERNPSRFLLYIGKGTCRQGRYSHKVYDCLNYEGRKVQLFREPCGIVKVGHMDEFDAIIDALKSLADREDGADNGD